MSEFLLELLSEEIPARMQARAAEDLKKLVLDGFAAAGLTPDAAEAHVTPRRLALVVTGLPATRPDVTEEKRGPRVGAPEQAVAGFLSSAGLSSLDECEQRDTGKGVFWFANKTVKGGPTADLLPGIIDQAVKNFPWPKSMRWRDGTVSWVRPLQSIIALFDGAQVEGAISFGGDVSISFGNSTVGHRFLSPARFAVTGFADYKAKLKAAHVVLDRVERKADILKQCETLAKAAGLQLIADEPLLEEVTGLVEYPHGLVGAIDQQFMDVPPEVLITSMRNNQKYFALNDASGKFADRFILMANRPTSDGGKAVVAGNERVLRARLSDARFFWDLDRKARLDSRLPALGKVKFHEKLGTVEAKVERIAKLAVTIAGFLPGADPSLVERAARLSKADLTTGMVGEFPELQGVMGRYYAIHDKEPPAVAEAVADHYKPAGQGDSCPTAPTSVAVALADRIDTLTGFFAIDEKPTGSKDPYALRRAALGIIRMVVENRLRLPLRQLFVAAHGLYAVPGLADADTVADALIGFLAERCKVTLREQGVRHDLIDAVFALGGEDDLFRLLNRVEALQGFLGSDDGINLLAGAKRAANILRIEEKKDGAAAASIDGAAIRLPQESALANALASVRSDAGAALKAEDFTGAMASLSSLRAPIDAFFEHVIVNDPDPSLRRNRLALLAGIRATLNQVADFSRIEG